MHRCFGALAQWCPTALYVRLGPLTQGSILIIVILAPEDVGLVLTTSPQQSGPPGNRADFSIDCLGASQLGRISLVKMKRRHRVCIVPAYFI